MKAMLLDHIARMEDDSTPLKLSEVPDPVPGEGEVLVRVGACAVCHTELDEIEGRTAPPAMPVIPGHQVVGRVEAAGPGAARWKRGDRVGVAWIYSACSRCEFCLRGEENLCPYFHGTGRDANGGYAQYMRVPEAFAYAIPDFFSSDAEAAPLLCAGAIGYRSLRLTGLQDGQHLGLMGFGASAHIVLKMVLHEYPRTNVYVFARSRAEREFAVELGAKWAGQPADTPPERLQAVIDTTPAWQPVVDALANLSRGGRLVINAIRKEEGDKHALLHLDYTAHLWLEKEIKSVANVTRKDVQEFLALAAGIPIRSEFHAYPLEDANRALVEMKTGKIRGAKVLLL